jgi:cell pole-organizing protein PopZ
MAQVSSAQREPSMEEILASIRRIIEDSDTTHRRPGEEQAVRAEAKHGTPGAEPPESSVVDVESFRADLREPFGRKAPDGAEVRQPPATPEGTQADTEREVPGTPLEPAAPTVEAAVIDALPDIEVDLAGDLDIEDDLRGDDHRVATELPAAESSASSHMPAMPSGEPYLPPEPRSELAGIMSEQAGRQVAAAFGELSDAFAASRKKSFDEMAEDMMRPMLQDWLDNNLPLLVERLVREEIERVARGVR